ncbi:MAG: hypothetical protein CL823_06240 [Crocinitomicaceae bacterium]|nr:hypothetical protein [Crocinitomicaceae bacterium]|tara:strand:+ start:2068 stop:2907 length:840 start_codon:yes stop_codon:yes gene_type:complete
MKKLMFALALVSLVFTSAQAQKQLGGEHNIEVNLTPFGDSPIDGSTLKYRNFIDDDKAVRVRLILSSSADTYTYWQEGELLESDPVSPQLHMYANSTTFGIAPGYEMHFDGTDNLSPYFGVEAYFITNSRTDDLEFWGPNDIDDAGQTNDYIIWTLRNTQSINNMGLNLLFGADYYFNDAIYVGFEAGIGLGLTSVGNHTISTVDPSHLTAFNMYFNNAFNAETAGADISDSFVGELPFSVVDGVLYNNYDEYPYPNHLSNNTIGNVFNASIRLGYLFD